MPRKQLWRTRPRAWRLYADEYVSGVEPDSGWYGRWLIKQIGRPMIRALTRAQQHYDSQEPARIRASVLHRAYGRRHR